MVLKGEKTEAQEFMNRWITDHQIRSSIKFEAPKIKAESRGLYKKNTDGTRNIVGTVTVNDEVIEFD